MTASLNPTREQFKFLYSLPPGQPVCMLNLLKFRATAHYGGEAPGAQALSGREAYGRYSDEAGPIFARVGGRQLWIGQPMASVIAPPGETWDLAFIALYPSVPAFIAMVRDTAYQAATRHRTAALENSRLIAHTALEPTASFAPLRYLD